MGEPSPDATLGDHDQGRHRIDPEAFRELWPLSYLDMVDGERGVVVPSLKHLSHVPLDAPRPTVELRVEQDEPGSLLNRLRRDGSSPA